MSKSKAKATSRKATGISFARGFKPPSAAKISSSLGKLSEADPAYEDDAGDAFFHPIPKPTCIDDWLAQYNETGQTFDQFMQENPWFSPRRLKYMRQSFNKAGTTLSEKYPEGKIYLLPLGSFGDGPQTELFGHLVEYTSIFFGSGIPVVQLDPVDLEVVGKGTSGQSVYWNGSVASEPEDHRTAASPPSAKRAKPSSADRHHLSARFHTGPAGESRFQLRADSVLDRLKKNIPDDALCLVALTMADLFDTKPDLFVAGLAGALHRVAVFSFFRYHPEIRFSSEFWHDIWLEDAVRASEVKKLLLLRSCRLLVHEVCHLFGVDHCIWHACCMNGSGHLQEDFSQPMQLCPVDLRKLRALCGFDVLERYKKLMDFFQRNNLTDDYHWFKRRVQFIESKGKCQT